MRIRLDLAARSAGRTRWSGEVHRDLDAALTRWFTMSPGARRGGYLSDADAPPVRLPYSWEMEGAPLIVATAVAEAHGDRVSTLRPDSKLNAEYLLVGAVWVSGKRFGRAARMPVTDLRRLRDGKAGRRTASERTGPSRSVGPEIEEVEWEEAPVVPVPPAQLLLPPPGPPGAAAAMAALVSARVMAGHAGKAWSAALEAACDVLRHGGEPAASALSGLASAMPDDFPDGETAAAWAMRWRKEWLVAAARIRDEARIPTERRFVLYASSKPKPPRASPSLPTVVTFAAPVREVARAAVSHDVPHAPRRAGPAPLTGLGRTVVEALKGRQPLRKAEVARLVGVGRGSANRIVDTLVAAGRLSEALPGRFGVAGGRDAR